MLFNSYEFIFLFLPLVLLFYWKFLSGQSNRIWFLTGSSYLFYGLWDFRFTILMLFCTIVNYFCGLKIANSNKLSNKRFWLLTAIILSLSVLCYFKYFNFFAQSINNIFFIFGFNSLVPILNLLLPVGISFFTFQALSYTIDIYRNEIKPCEEFMEFACFVSLFPQLVAGPIVRYKELAMQLNNLKTQLTHNDVFNGLVFFIVGLFKKLIIADQIAFIINPYWNDFSNLGFIGSWLIVIGYTYQIYFDFSGYSDMAVGIARLLGLKLPRNFNLPYTAQNISEFWKRWHISLSKWLRDYLYIGLGGSHYGTIKTFFNLMITMLLGGLWHGANWTFVFWGFYHGLLLILFHLIKNKIQINLLPSFSRKITFLLVIIGWVFFRSETFEKALFILKSMIGFNGFGLDFLLNQSLNMNIFFFFGISIIFSHYLPDTWDVEWLPSKKLVMIMVPIALLCVLMLYNGNEFLYYQF